MARILILLAVVLGVIWWLRSRAESRQQQAARTSRSANNASRDDSAEAMVQCAHCGVHLPRSEAIAWHGLHYCRRSHLPDDSGDHA
ncbi:PP0621 family protein [Cupriavidus sp. WKF15]|uniref:PP0621 family protein n=1 Tax=Cupriavidus sp. WKF15 TaxID=3032282 RepID=UPI0023E274D5|nr:PP0621 family protein [Cupriavidus sp. WKF15]WER45524.1 PP0621 family protein [Cupriavidus sp. WKF15]